MVIIRMISSYLDNGKEERNERIQSRLVEGLSCIVSYVILAPSPYHLAHFMFSLSLHSSSVTQQLAYFALWVVDGIMYATCLVQCPAQCQLTFLAMRSQNNGQRVNSNSKRSPFLQKSPKPKL